MSENETLLKFGPAPFAPSISYGGSEPSYSIRGQNLWLKSKTQETMYAKAYKGSLDIGEPVDILDIGTVSWDNTDDPFQIVGTNFLANLRAGSFVLITDTGFSHFGVILEVVSDTEALISKPFSDIQSGKDACVLPIMYPLGTKRATQIRGNSTKYPGGHYLGVGQGELRLNGKPLNIRQSIKLTVIGTVGAGGAGNITVTVTADGMTGNPNAVVVAVANNDTATIVAGKIAAALKLDADVNAFFYITSNGADVYLIAKTGTANDVTMNAAYVNTTASGLTAVPTATQVTAGGTFQLSKTPKYALYDPITNSYTDEGYGVSLPPEALPSNPLITLASPAGGIKKMQAGDYGVRVFAMSDPRIGGTGGYSNPSENYTVTIVADDKIEITFNKPMSIETGQNAWGIALAKYEDSTAATNNSKTGPWYVYKVVNSAELATENTVTDGTVTGLKHTFEFADGELEANPVLLSFDNFLPYECEYVDLIASENGYTPVFFSSLGRRTATQLAGTSPGPALVVGKPDNPEGVMRDKAVSTFQGDTILGIISVRGRHWLICEASLQTAVLTGVPAAPMTIRSFWDNGFRNPYNVKFIKDYVFGHSTAGFIRSIGVGDTSDIDFEFSLPVDDYTFDWETPQVITDADPKNKAACFFYSGIHKESGYYVTLVLPFLPNQNIWNPPILLSARGQVETNTVVGTAGATTNIPVTVTAPGMTGSPKVVNVAVTNGDSASVAAGKIRTALDGDVDVSAFFTVGGSGASYSLSVIDRAAREATMNVGHGAITGIAASATSVESWATVQDFIVSGTAAVGQKLYFLAGGRKADDTVSVRTYEFDAEDGIPVECYMAWAYTELNSEDVPMAIKGVASLIGCVDDAKVEIHTITEDGVVDLPSLETGHNDPLKTVVLGSRSPVGRIREKRQNMDQASKLTARLSFDSTDGSGRFDELNLIIATGAGSRK